ncbi:MAG: protein kinase [Terracidiphilus sp.]
MKFCPQCDTGHPDDAATCPIHAVPLTAMRDLRPGIVVANSYRIFRKLGQGAAGSLYLAADAQTDQPRALRFLTAELSRDVSFMSRYQRTARTLSKIHQRSILNTGVLETAEDGSLFFAMDFIDGPSLRELMNMAPGPFDVSLSLSIARCIAEGLGAAHAAKVYHFDIKPENILIGRDGEKLAPKIANFGIGVIKTNGTGPGHSSHGNSSRSVLASSYSAPEQWLESKPAELDGRTDLYALGAILFEMLTGEALFQAKDFEDWALHHVNPVPRRPSLLRPEIASWNGLDPLVLSLLAAKAQDRPSDSADVLRKLDAVQFGSPVIEAPLAVVATRPAIVEPPPAVIAAPPAIVTEPAPAVVELPRAAIATPTVVTAPAPAVTVVLPAVVMEPAPAVIETPRAPVATPAVAAAPTPAVTTAPPAVTEPPRVVSATPAVATVPPPAVTVAPPAAREPFPPVTDLPPAVVAARPVVIEPPLVVPVAPTAVVTEPRPTVAEPPRAIIAAPPVVTAPPPAAAVVPPAVTRPSPPPPVTESPRTVIAVPPTVAAPPPAVVPTRPTVVIAPPSAAVDIKRSELPPKSSENVQAVVVEPPSPAIQREEVLDDEDFEAELLKQQSYFGSREGGVDADEFQGNDNEPPTSFIWDSFRNQNPNSRVEIREPQSFYAAPGKTEDTREKPKPTSQTTPREAHKSPIFSGTRDAGRDTQDALDDAYDFPQFSSVIPARDNIPVQSRENLRPPVFSDSKGKSKDTGERPADAKDPFDPFGRIPGRGGVRVLPPESPGQIPDRPRFSGRVERDNDALFKPKGADDWPSHSLRGNTAKSTEAGRSSMPEPPRFIGRVDASRKTDTPPQNLADLPDWLRRVSSEFGPGNGSKGSPEPQAQLGGAIKAPEWGPENVPELPSAYGAPSVQRESRPMDWVATGVTNAPRQVNVPRDTAEILQPAPEPPHVVGQPIPVYEAPEILAADEELPGDSEAVDEPSDVEVPSEVESAPRDTGGLLGLMSSGSANPYAYYVDVEEEEERPHKYRVVWMVAAAVLTIVALGFAIWKAGFSNPTQPMVNMTQQCDSGDAKACAGLAQWYEQTNTVADGDEKAVTFYSKACDGSFAPACRKLGLKYLLGNGATRDNPKAIDLLGRGCDLGDSQGCDTLADIYHEGKGVPVNDRKAAALYGKACNAGDDFGCKWAKKLELPARPIARLYAPRPVATSSAGSQ